MYRLYISYISYQHYKDNYYTFSGLYVAEVMAECINFMHDNFLASVSSIFLFSNLLAV